MGWSNIQYRGVLDLTNISGYEKLASYDVMLFPTFWDDEGFPGVIVDAHIAGLPVIASDWNMNREVIEHNKTGRIIPVHSPDSLAREMGKFINGELDVNLMQKNCLEEASSYDVNQVLSEEILSKIGLLEC